MAETPMTNGQARTAWRLTRPIRVLHVIQNLNYGGMERLLADIVSRVDRSRFESHVLVLQYVGRFGEELAPVASVRLARPMSRLSMLWPGSLIRDMREIAPDVIHSHSGVWYKAALAARAAGVRRVIHTEHGRNRPDPWMGRVLDGLASRRTDVVVAVSEALRAELRDRVVHRGARVDVVTNGVDTERFCRRENREARARLGIPSDALVLGSIGRLEPVKGYDVMIEAFARLHQCWHTAPAPVLVLGGDGSERPQLEAAVARHGIGDAVRLLGWRDDIEELYGVFDLFTMSSRSEGTSVSLLEAMSAELCPVVTDVGGNAATLGPRLAHRLVQSENPDALAEAWRTALSDGARRARDATLARERVRERFDVTAMVREYERLYEGGSYPPDVTGARTAPSLRAGAAPVRGG